MAWRRKQLTFGARIELNSRAIIVRLIINVVENAGFCSPHFPWPWGRSGEDSRRLVAWKPRGELVEASAGLRDPSYQHNKSQTWIRRNSRASRNETRFLILILIIILILILILIKSRNRKTNGISLRSDDSSKTRAPLHCTKNKSSTLKILLHCLDCWILMDPYWRGGSDAGTVVGLGENSWLPMWISTAPLNWRSLATHWASRRLFSYSHLFWRDEVVWRKKIEERECLLAWQQWQGRQISQGSSGD